MSRIATYRIVIIEPSVIVRAGIRELLEECPEFKVKYSFPDLVSFREEPGAAEADMVLLNPLLVDFHRQFAVRSVFPDYAEAAFVAVLYSYVDPETIESFDGFIDIYDDARQLEKKLKKILAGRQGAHTYTGENADLSEREKEILVSVAQGLTNKEIADRHHISVHTVISHRKNIARKTGIKTVSGLTMYAVVNNLISREDFI